MGNFRHLPNGEAVEYLCRDILPRLDPELLAAHPLSVVGSRLDEKVRAHGRGLPGVRWSAGCPSIAPYLERARVCVVPLLHGAGVKGKIVESLMAGHAGRDDADRRRGHGPAPWRARADRRPPGRPGRRASPTCSPREAGSGSPTRGYELAARPT